MKMVRDRIPELYPQHTYRPATPVETDLLLRLKLAEETGEALSAPTASALVHELADVLEVVYALARHSGVNPSELDDVRRAKRGVHGAFWKCWVLL